MIKRRSRSNLPSEAQTKKCIEDWLDAKVLVWIRVQVLRPVTGKDNKIMWVKVRKSQLGASDLVVISCPQVTKLGNKFIYEWKPLCIEVKAPKGNLSDNQLEWIKNAEEQGIRCIVARRLEDVTDVIKC